MTLLRMGKKPPNNTYPSTQTCVPELNSPREYLKSTFVKSVIESDQDTIKQEVGDNCLSLFHYKDLSRRMLSGIRGDKGGKNEEAASHLSFFTSSVIGYDVIISVQETKYHCHRFMLASSSPVFNRMFAGPLCDPNKHNIIISNVDPNTFGCLLIYIYTGVANISPKTVTSILVLADMYVITGLSELCIEFFHRNAEEIFQCPDSILELPESLLIQIIRSDQLQVREITLFEAVLQWGEARQNERSDNNQTIDFEEVMKHIRFPRISVSDLYSKVKPRAGREVPPSLLIDALFSHFNWGASSTSERNRDREIPENRKRRRVSFIQNVSFSD